MEKLLLTAQTDKRNQKVQQIASDEVKLGRNQLKQILHSRHKLDFALKLALGSEVHLHDLSSMNQSSIRSFSSSVEKRYDDFKSIHSDGHNQSDQILENLLNSSTHHHSVNRSRNLQKRTLKSTKKQNSAFKENLVCQNIINDQRSLISRDLEEAKSCQNYNRVQIDQKEVEGCKSSLKRILEKQKRTEKWIEFIIRHHKLQILVSTLMSSSRVKDATFPGRPNANADGEQFSIEIIDSFFKQIVLKLEKLDLTAEQEYNSKFMLCQLTEGTLREHDLSEKLSQKQRQIQEHLHTINSLKEHIASLGKQEFKEMKIDLTQSIPQNAEGQPGQSQILTYSISAKGEQEVFMSAEKSMISDTGKKTQQTKAKSPMVWQWESSGEKNANNEYSQLKGQCLLLSSSQISEPNVQQKNENEGGLQDSVSGQSSALEKSSSSGNSSESVIRIQQLMEIKSELVKIINQNNALEEKVAQTTEKLKEKECGFEQLLKINSQLNQEKQHLEKYVEELKLILQKEQSKNEDAVERGLEKDLHDEGNTTTLCAGKSECQFDEDISSTPGRVKAQIQQQGNAVASLDYYCQTQENTNSDKKLSSVQVMKASDSGPHFFKAKNSDLNCSTPNLLGAQGQIETNGKTQQKVKRHQINSQIECDNQFLKEQLIRFQSQNNELILSNKELQEINFKLNQGLKALREEIFYLEENRGIQSCQEFAQEQVKLNSTPCSCSEKQDNKALRKLVQHLERLQKKMVKRLRDRNAQISQMRSIIQAAQSINSQDMRVLEESIQNRQQRRFKQIENLRDAQQAWKIQYQEAHKKALEQLEVEKKILNQCKGKNQKFKLFRKQKSQMKTLQFKELAV